MARFVAVINNWFMKDSHTDVVEIEAKTLSDAIDKADAIAQRQSRAFNDTNSRVIVLEDYEVLANRRLTWKERFLGRLDL
jgi:hypothetical protein